MQYQTIFSAMTLFQIREWFETHQRRQRMGERVPTITEIARLAGISRQTVYAVLKDNRCEFGQVAQIRLGRVINQISADPAYNCSRGMRIRFTSGVPKLLIGH